MKKILLLLFLLGLSHIFTTTLFAQKPVVSPWQPVSSKNERSQISGSIAQTFVLDHSHFANQLPLQVGDQQQTTSLLVPGPEGQTRRFVIREVKTMEESLARRYPMLKTYAGYDPEDPRSLIRLDYDGTRTHMAVSTPQGAYLIDPAGTDNHYQVYREGNEPESVLAGALCESTSLPQPTAALSQTKSTTNTMTAASHYLKEFRLALAATGEYTQFRGGKTAALSAMVTTVNRANLVLERDLGIRLVLSTGTDNLIFTDPATDPFPSTNTEAATWLNAAQQAIDSRLSPSAYDLGHVLTLGSGGVAFTATVCVEGKKAMGRSGQRYAAGHTADLFFFLHEIGHQLGGTHTFNGYELECADNYHAPTAWEPGSGSTVMSYAYFCGNQQVDGSPSMVNYFHGGSIEQIKKVTDEACPVLVAVDNAAPMAHITPGLEGRVLPKGTPYVLRGSHFDEDGDKVTYTWEQMNTGPQGAPDQVSGSAPLYRSYPPSAEAQREFPRLNAVLSGTMPLGDGLVDYGRALNFRLTVRDGAGGQGWADVALQVSDTIGPLRFSYPAHGDILVPGSETTLLWDVNDTDKAPVSLTELNVLFSEDNGHTWDVLTFFTPNDGAQRVMLPAIQTTTARVKLESTDGVVYTISPRFTMDYTAPSACETVSAQAGKVYIEEWYNRPGNTLPSTLPVSDNAYQVLPDYFSSLTAMEAPRNTGDNYLRRMRAIVCPPQSGQYTFHMYGDDNSRVYVYPLNQPEQRQPVAGVEGYTYYREWNKYPGQTSAPIVMEAGTVYVLEVWHKENKGWDHLGIGWTMPNGQQELPIPGWRVSPYVAYPAASDALPVLRQVCESGTTNWFLDNPGESLLIRWQSGADEKTLLAGPGSYELPASAEFQVTVSFLDTKGTRHVLQQERACLDENASPAPALVSEIWLNVPGTSVKDIPTDRLSDRLFELTELRSGDLGSQYGERIRALFRPATTGYHRFMVSGDDDCALYLSADDSPAGKQLVASVEGWTMPGETTRYPSQVSGLRYLEAGKAYYIEVLHKENNGAGHVQVGVENTTTGERHAAIPASLLSAYITDKGRLLSRMGQDNPQPIEANTAYVISVYPNPSHGKIHIGSADSILPEASVAITNTSGQTVLAFDHSGGPLDIDLGQQVPGLYLLSLKTATGVLTERIIIE